MGDAFRRRSESVSFLRVFCRTGETSNMPLDDPQLPSQAGTHLRCNNCALHQVS